MDYTICPGCGQLRRLTKHGRLHVHGGPGPDGDCIWSGRQAKPLAVRIAETKTRRKSQERIDAAWCRKAKKRAKRAARRPCLIGNEGCIAGLHEHIVAQQVVCVACNRPVCRSPGCSIRVKHRRVCEDCRIAYLQSLAEPKVEIVEQLFVQNRSRRAALIALCSALKMPEPKPTDEEPDSIGTALTPQERRAFFLADAMHDMLKIMYSHTQLPDDVLADDCSIDHLGWRKYMLDRNKPYLPRRH